MISKQRTAKEKAWHTNVSEWARMSPWLVNVYGGYVRDPYQFQIDHIIGAQAKRKINGASVKVGEFAVMPIPIELHDISSNHPLNRTLNPGAYRDKFGHETDVWHYMLTKMQGVGIELPFDNDLIEAVLR